MWRRCMEPGDTKLNHREIECSECAAARAGGVQQAGPSATPPSGPRSARYVCPFTLGLPMWWESEHLPVRRLLSGAFDVAQRPLHCDGHEHPVGQAALAHYGLHTGCSPPRANPCTTTVTQKATLIWNAVIDEVGCK